MDYSITLKEYAAATADVLIRKLKKDFIAEMISLLPFIPAGPAGIILNFLFGWIFDWILKQGVFLGFCVYTDLRVAHQGTELGAAIRAEIMAKKGGSADEIKKAEEEADRLFDNAVVIGR